MGIKAAAGEGGVDCQNKRIISKVSSLMTQPCWRHQSEWSCVVTTPSPATNNTNTIAVTIHHPLASTHHRSLSVSTQLAHLIG